MKAIVKAAGIATILGCAMACSNAQAVNVLAVRDLPIQHMTDEDREILFTTVAQVLQKAQDGATVAWENPKTGARGELTPRASFKRESRACRDLEIANSARGRNNRLVLTLCQQDDGDWKVEPQ